MPAESVAPNGALSPVVVSTGRPAALTRRKPRRGRSGRAGRSGRSQFARARFWKVFIETGTVYGTCKRLRVDTARFYEWANDPERGAEFLAGERQARELATQRLEQIAIKRASRVSDKLLIMLLKAQRPEVYRENLKPAIDRSTTNNVLVQAPRVLLERLTDEELEVLERVWSKVGPDALDKARQLEPVIDGEARE